jgi:hypothetical protein
MSQHPGNGLDPEIQRWADVLTVEKLAEIRTGNQYRKMILTARAVHAAVIGLPVLLCVGTLGSLGLTGLLVLIALGVASVVALIVITNVYGHRAGLPLYPLDWRVKRIIQRDRWNLTWWSGPPPPLHPWSGQRTSGNFWW